MAEKKSQHYVPKFYLKNFSNNGLVSLVNLKKVCTFIDIPYKDQCSEDYFYGKDLIIENALGDIETKTMSVIELLKNEVLPIKKSEEYQTLLLFIIVQSARTKMAVNINTEIVSKIQRKTLEYKLNEEILKDIKIRSNNLLLFSLQKAVANLIILSDLDYILINNNSSIDFITSDNPVVKYNQYLRHVKIRSTNGFACSGLLIFMPITPKKLILLYDSNIYKVSNSGKGCIILNNEDDIKKINEIQCLNANEAIYFYNSSNNSNLENWVKRVFVSRKSEKVNVNEYSNINDSNNSLLHIKGFSIEFDKSFSFIKLTDKASKIKECKRVWSVRNQDFIDMADLYEEFTKECKLEKYEFDEFYKFLEDKKKSFKDKEK